MRGMVMGSPENLSSLRTFARLKWGLGLLSLFLILGDAEALPSKVIILRHGEKSVGTVPNGIYGLCSVGWSRSLALNAQYLGKDALQSLLPKKGPAAFFAITTHTMELASPSAKSWELPLITYSAVKVPNSSSNDARGVDDSTEVLNQRTQEAAKDVMHNPRWNNKVVVMVWEHHHIADAQLESISKSKVTLRQLLNIERISNVPATWNGDNYDYFWVVTFGNRSSSVPTGFEAIRQDYDDPSIPSNSWGQYVTLPSDCVDDTKPNN
jgi:hypothetical protein